LLLAAVNFEWTVGRAVLFLSDSPNSELREHMRACYGLDSYKGLWKAEVETDTSRKSLPDIVRNWSSVRKAFEARNRLVHGRGRCTRNMAEPHVDSLVKAVAYVDSYCEFLGYPLHSRMPVRRRRRLVPN
jgi:hypothetical protein